MRNLEGKVAAVTGAASGIGRALALAFAREGMHVGLADIDPLDGVADEVRKAGVKALVHRVDVSSASDVERFAASLKEVHVVCNNAGVSPLGAVLASTCGAWSTACARSRRG
jgi:NAD(P)-dependent dehydrogenase (short-subunit alcohol dehydrogenase family)